MEEETVATSFRATMFRMPGKGGWTFVPVPDGHSFPVTGGWGRTPVRATVDGRSWATSIWTESSGRVLLPVPKKIRGKKGDGDEVQAELELDLDRC